MATYSSHRLIMGKEEIDNFSVSMGIFGFCFTKMFIAFTTFHKTFVQVSEFDWLPGRQKGLIFVRMLKIFGSETVRWIKLILCICVNGLSST